MSGIYWTEEEEDFIRVLFSRGLSDKEMETEFKRNQEMNDRTAKAIEEKRKSLKLYFHRKSPHGTPDKRVVENIRKRQKQAGFL
jgi:hypothetical protein